MQIILPEGRFCTKRTGAGHDEQPLELAEKDLRNGWFLGNNDPHPGGDRSGISTVPDTGAPAGPHGAVET